jgi:hypothetical protein
MAARKPAGHARTQLASKYLDLRKFLAFGISQRCRLARASGVPVLERGLARTFCEWGFDYPEHGVNPKRGGGARAVTRRCDYRVVARALRQF